MISILIALLIAPSNAKALKITESMARDRIHQVSSILERETGDAEFDQFEQCSSPKIVKRFKLKQVCEVLFEPMDRP